MARNDSDKWGSIRPGRRPASFDHMVSPLGEDEAETPVYSPSRTVTGSKGQPRGQVSEQDAAGQGDKRHHNTEYRKNERRGG